MTKSNALDRLSIEERLLVLGIAAGRAHSEREFTAACAEFRVALEAVLPQPEAPRSLYAALNANHD